MGPILLVDTVGNVTVNLELLSGGPAIGLTFAAVTVSLKKAGETAFSSYPVDASTFIDVGGGSYDIVLDENATDTLGNITLKIGGTVVVTTLSSAFITETVAIPPEEQPIAMGLSAVFGFVLDVSGSPVKNASVFARVLAAPTLQTDVLDFIVVDDIFIIDLLDHYVVEDADQQASGPIYSTAIATNSLVVNTDANGYFYFVLASGITVDIAIPAVNFRRTMDVPPSPTNLWQVP